MPFYIESPFERIVDVHWPDDGPPDDLGLGPPYCNLYGNGMRSEAVNPGLITGRSYGPHQYAPLAPPEASFKTSGNDGPGGFPGHLTGATMQQPPPPTLQVPPYGDEAVSLFLGNSELSFNPAAFLAIQDATGLYGSIGWAVPIVGGAVNRTLRVIKNYTIKLEWHKEADHTRPGEQIGIAFSHPVPGHVGIDPSPTEPAAIFGPGEGGTGSYIYDFKYEEWAQGNIHVTEENQFDPNLGGPARVWFMLYQSFADPPWRATGMPAVLVGLGDWYTWEVIAECQPQPPIFLPT